jgi:DNA invertase Pin-like site-specific DNA recombinase
MKIGYARVSTDDQTLALQQDALQAAGCTRVLSDTASGSKRDRAGLEEALEGLTAGDVLVVWKLDRLGRSTAHLLETIDRIRGKGAAFCSLTEGMDTTTACGEMIFTVMAALAQFERKLIVERTKAGLAAARARGVFNGRKRVTEPSLIRDRAAALGNDYRAVCAELGISPGTYYAAMKGVA